MPNKINGFLKFNGDWEVSSVGTDNLQRKQILPTRNDSMTGALTMNVRECLSHLNTPWVRINLYNSVVHTPPFDWVKVAEALACPLCWKKLLKIFEDPKDWKLEDEIFENDDPNQRVPTFKKSA